MRVSLDAKRKGRWEEGRSVGDEVDRRRDRFLLAFEATLAQDAAPLTLRGTAPHAVVDAVGERVLEAIGLHRALGTDLACLVDADAVGREEGGRCQRTA